MDLTMESYIKWKKRFEVYRKASGIDKKEDVQVAILLHCLGEQCLDIHNTFVIAEEERDNYAAIIGKFDEYFVPAKNESVYSHLFFTRSQQGGESFDAYLKVRIY